ncbi:MAG: hypothetical protein CMF38_05165 [Legionellaceae bacterium]|nr:hypothetical protein [Legionellaceae bacterium]HAF87340.1 hypothetical protein [Legionellales bacterium]HCA88732.1 hypothetical protein [Legionellales bacterium]|tara:strand:+ start:1641 stop:2954 length:1314 start_codon:yes stop_codon:yes gene_type:complete
MPDTRSYEYYKNEFNKLLQKLGYRPVNTFFRKDNYAKAQIHLTNVEQGYRQLKQNLLKLYENREIKQQIEDFPLDDIESFLQCAKKALDNDGLAKSNQLKIRCRDNIKQLEQDKNEFALKVYHILIRQPIDLSPAPNSICSPPLPASNIEDEQAKINRIIERINNIADSEVAIRLINHYQQDENTWQAYLVFHNLQFVLEHLKQDSSIQHKSFERALNDLKNAMYQLNQEEFTSLINNNIIEQHKKYFAQHAQAEKTADRIDAVANAAFYIGLGLVLISLLAFISCILLTAIAIFLSTVPLLAMSVLISAAVFLNAAAGSSLGFLMYDVFFAIACIVYEQDDAGNLTCWPYQSDDIDNMYLITNNSGRVLSVETLEKGYIEGETYKLKLPESNDNREVPQLIQEKINFIEKIMTDLRTEHAEISDERFNHSFTRQIA